jgi:hypothetical protein
MEEATEQERTRDHGEHQQEDNLHRLEDGYRDVDIRRDTEGHDAGDTKQRHHDFGKSDH